MFIELKKIELPIESVHKIESYPEPGLYLVSDGIGHSIVSVLKDSKMVSSIPIPFEQIKNNIINDERIEMTKKISEVFEGTCDNIMCSVSELKQSVKSYTDQQKSIENGFVSSETLLEAIKIVCNNQK